MSDELWKGRGSVALPLLPLPFFCLPLPFLCLPSQVSFLSSQCGLLPLEFFYPLRFLLCPLPFLLRLKEKRLVVRGAAPTHRCRE